MGNLVDNEQTKLLANALDRTSTACVTVGVIAPVAAALYNFAGLPIQPWVIVGGVVFWIFSAAVLHLSARAILKGLRE